ARIPRFGVGTSARFVSPFRLRATNRRSSSERRPASPPDGRFPLTIARMSAGPHVLRLLVVEEHTAISIEIRGLRPRKSDGGSTHEIRNIQFLYLRRLLRRRIAYYTAGLREDALCESNRRRSLDSAGDGRFGITVQWHVRRLGDRGDGAE